MSNPENDLLDDLLRMAGKPIPERASEPEKATTRPATYKQITFLRKLASERDNCEHIESAITSGLSTTEASELIDTTLKLPKRPRERKPRSEPAELGYYAHDGQLWVVVNSAKGNRYAKRLDPANGQWEYVQGAVSQLTADEKLTDDEFRARAQQALAQS